jgi:LytS/YehU family sensor histidine kinase
MKVISNWKNWLLVAAIGALTGLIAQPILHGPSYSKVMILGTAAAISGGLAWLFMFKADLRKKADLHFGENPLLPRLSRSTLPVPVSPLFLFNTLHNISALALVNPPKASATVEKLADFIRCVSDLAKDKRTLLSQEIKCADLYLSIEKERFGQRLQVITDISSECLEIKVPHFLLLPIVENAIHHGVEPSDQCTQVILSGRSDGNKISIEISDTGQGIEMQRADNLIATGPSLSRLKKLLAKEFGKNAQIRIEALAPSGTRVKITIPKMENQVRF